MTENALGEFLHARRDRLTPEDVGLVDLGGRRAPGLRREELATLAGVSQAYYIRLEQGHNRHPSPSLVDALARALRLDEHETTHLHVLAAPPTARTSHREPETVRPELARLVAETIAMPAFVIGIAMDVLSANAIAGAVHPSFAVGRNLVHDAFLDDESQRHYADLDAVRRNAVASLRAAAGTAPDHPRLTEVVGTLSLRSAAFQTLWARHEVRTKIAGRKRFSHPLAGDLALDYEALTVTDHDHQQLVVYHAAEDSREAHAVDFLRSWDTRTDERHDPRHRPERQVQRAHDPIHSRSQRASPDPHPSGSRRA